MNADSNYNQLRSEYINIFSSFRSLFLGQLAIIGSLCAGLAGENVSMQKTNLIIFVATLLIYFSSILGHNWFSQAVHQASFIFVFFELPNIAANDKLEPKNYWLLANRSCKFVGDTKHYNSYYSGQELHLFHIFQSSVISGVLIFYVLFSEASVRKVHTVPELLVFLLVALTCFAAVMINILLFNNSKTLVKDKTRAWLAYSKDYSNYNTQYKATIDAL